MGELALLDLMILEVVSNWNNFVVTAWKSCTRSYTFVLVFLCVVWFGCCFLGSLVGFLDFLGWFGHGEAQRP